MRERHSTILHITDLHLKKDRLHNQRQVLTAFFTDLEEQCKEHGRPDLILFTGDLVHDADDPSVYEVLFDEFIEPLTQRTGCNYSRIYFCPGNHDLMRSSVKSTAEEMEKIRALSSHDDINQSYVSGALSHIIKERLNSYLDFNEMFQPDGQLYSNEIGSAFDFSELGISLVTLNTSWSGFAGIDKVSDLRKLIVPDVAVSELLDRLPDDRYVILTQHHPMQWLTEDSETHLLSAIGNKIDAHLFGHVHDPRPESTLGYGGRIFKNQSGALYSWINDRYMGYSLVKVKAPDKHVHAVWRTYYQRRREFSAAVDVSRTNGHLFSSEAAERYYSSQISAEKLEILRKWCSKDNVTHIRTLFDEGIVERPISQIFVPPPLKIRKFKEGGADTSLDEITELPISFEDLAIAKENFVISAHPEYGRTTLLQQICCEISSRCVEFKESNPFIAAYITFREFQPGTNRAEKAVRDALPELPNGITVKDLLNEGLLVLCIDDVDSANITVMKVLREFIGKYNSNRFIFSTRVTKQNSYIQEDMAMPVLFSPVSLGQFSRKNLRSLVKKWDETKIGEEQLLNRVIAELRAINVPQTPINSALVLDIMSSDPTFSPINRPTLIERFLEQLLQKRSLAEAQRRKFDFKNQVHFLGYLAAHMCKENQYALEESQLYDFTRQYLTNFGLPFGAQDIIVNLENARILGSKTAGGKISFRFRAFLEFFVAKHIAADQDFKEWVLDENRYLSYLNEIEYYAGLERSDLKLLEIVSARHEDHVLALFGKKFEEFILKDDRMVIPMNVEESIRYADDLAAQLDEAPLTESERDEVLEAEIPRDSEGRQEVYRPEPKDKAEKFVLSLFMYSNLVKNSELIPDHSKRDHLTNVLRSWAQIFFASFIHIPSLVKNRSITVNGLRYAVAFPKTYNDNQVARQISIMMPKELSRLMFLFLGSEKLENQLKHPSLAEANEPKIVDFFRSCLYIDLKLRNWSKVPQKFSDRVLESNYYKEVMLFKSSEVYRYGGFDEEVAENLQNHISATFAKLYSKSRRVEADMRVRKKKSLRMDRLLTVARSNKRDEG